MLIGRPQGVNAYRRLRCYDGHSGPNVMADATIRHYRWSRAEYDRAVEAGVFDPDAPLACAEVRIAVDDLLP